MLSTSLYYVHVSSFYHTFGSVTEPELDALNYIKQNLPANESIITFSDAPSSGKLYPFAKVNMIQNLQRFSNILLNEENPYALIYILGLSRAKYVYMTQRDYEILNSSTGLFKDFLPYFPKVFVNDAATIYEVPPLTPSSTEASVGVLHFSPSLQRLEDTIWIDDSFAEGWYPYRQYGDVKNYESEVGNGLMEISVTSNQSGNIWVSYALSGLCLNTTIYSTLFFRYHVENNFTWFTFQLWNSTDKVFFYVGHLSDIDFTTKVLTLPANQTITRIEVIVGTVKDAPADTTARAHVDYIKFSSPATSWMDDAFLRDWAFYGKYGDVLDWSAHSDGDILKINVTSNQSGTVWVSYSPPLYVKTKDSILSFRYKVDNDYTWFTIILQNASHTRFFYEGHLTDKTFTTKSFSLQDDQTITRVEIIVETTDKAPAGSSAIAYLDYIEISQKTFSDVDIFPALFAASLQLQYSFLYVDDALMKNLDAYASRYTHILLTSDPPIPIESLIKWVSAGNTLTILNTYGNGFFAYLLGINSSSPLLSIRSLGLGKVLYINSFPTKVGNESASLKQDFLDKIRETLTLDEYVHKVNTLPAYNSTFGSIEINGDLKAFTDVLRLEGSVDLMDSPFQFNGSREIGIFGEVNLIIKNASLLISPSESYTIIKPERYPVEGEIFVNGSHVLIVADTDAIYEYYMPVHFKFKTTGLSLHARLPSINASGTITFDQLDVQAALYIPLAGIVQQRAEVQGNVKFDTMYISSLLTIFSMFHADGKILNLAETTSPRPTIPWVEVLTSPYNLAFNAIFVLGIVSYVIIKRRTRTTINEKT